MAQNADTPPLTRGHKKKERTRRQLIAAAIDVIAEKGEAFTIGDVASAAGMSNGTFYNYFDDRDQLIDAVVPEVLTAFAAEGALGAPHEDPAVRFATVSSLVLVRAAATPDSLKVILRLDAVQDAIINGEAATYLRQDLTAGAAAGRFLFEDLNAAIDVVVGSLLIAARRTVYEAVDQNYHRQVVERLLCSLGVDRHEASTVSEEAVAAAVELHDQIFDPSLEKAHRPCASFDSCLRPSGAYSRSSV